MAYPDGLTLRPRGAKTLGFCLSLGVFLAGVTLTCLLGDVQHTFSSRQISGTGVVGSVSLPTLVPWGPGGLQLDLFEEGRGLGPEVEDSKKVREVRGGSYTVRRGRWALSSPTRLYFSASDGSRPHLIGRQYTVRYPRRQLPGAIALLLGSWILLPLGAVRYLRMSADVPAYQRPALDTVAWSVLVIGVLYSLFSVQAWLPLPNAAWFLAIVGVGLPPFFGELGRRLLQLPVWSPWLAGLLAWAAFTLLGGSSYASPAAATGFFAVSLGGLVVYFGSRGAFEACEERRSSMLLGLFVAATGLSLARDAGFDLVGRLASLGLTSVWPGKLVNPWTTKFVGHWLLVVAWCAVAALGWDRRRFRRGILLVLSLGLVAIGVNSSRAAIVALLVSVAVAVVAWRWPKVVRRVVVYGLVSVTVVAPLLAGVSWRAQSELSGQASEGVREALDLDRRGGKWEFSRRFIALRPFEGWGFGASRSLPGRGLPIQDALGLDPGARSPPPSYPALAGGHPHNAALLTWLDLGFVGALLVAGLLAAIGRSIAALEEQRRVHSAVLGLLSVTAVYLLFNYPVWEPEVASILWMSAALVATVLPRSTVSRRQLLRSGAAVLLVLLFGCAFLVQERLSRWWTVRELRTSTVTLDRSAGQLTVGDEEWALRYDGGLDAGAELRGAGPGTPAVIRGWAYGPPGVEAPEEVLVFVGSDLVGVAWPERPSPEVFGRVEPKDIRALTAGFEVPVDPARVDLSAPVTVVALRPGYSQASQLPPLSTESP